MSFINQPISLTSLLFGKDRKVGQYNMNVVTNESTTDILTITKQPVQQGASITDHSFKEPTSLTMQAFAQDNLFVSLSDVYKQFLELQDSRVPFDVYTPKRIYRNMLMASLSQTTDKSTENCLSLSFSFQEVIIVSVTTVQVPRRRQKNPGATGATQGAGKKSALLSLKQGIGGLIQ